jgi:hypothetical protein
MADLRWGDRGARRRGRLRRRERTDAERRAGYKQDAARWICGGGGGTDFAGVGQIDLRAVEALGSAREARVEVAATPACYALSVTVLLWT